MKDQEEHRPIRPLDNQTIGAAFEELAELLELKGENPFKIKAYQRAARVLGGLDRPVADAAADGTLTGIPGIGKGIAEKVHELLETGTTTLTRELHEEFPTQLLSLMQIPGLGPRKAAQLFRELGVAGVERLEAACSEGLVRALKGFGEKSEQRILKGIAQLRQLSGRMNLDEADSLAAAFLEELSGLEEVEKITVVGSLRRRKETIGDLDLLAVSHRPQAVMDAFLRHPKVERVLLSGQRKCSVLTPGQIQVDLRVVDSGSFGSALQYFTGSQGHNIALRKLAKIKGYRRVSAATEEEIYAALDLSWIPPELREDQGEIDAAAAGKLPRLVKGEDLRGDFHVHSRWSDGVNTIEDLVEAAARRGYQYLGISDHSGGLVVAGGLSIERNREQGKSIARINQNQGTVRLLRSSEVDILPDGKLDYPDELLGELDIVIASIHGRFSLDRDTQTMRLIRAMENPNVDIIGHPSGRLLGQRAGYELDWEAVLQAAARTGTAIEINSYPQRLDLPDIQCRRARELGVVIAINSDAHTAAGLDVIRYGVGVARRGWLEAEQVLNTWSLPKLQEWLATRRRPES